MAKASNAIKVGDKNVVRTRGLVLLKPGHKEIRKLKKEALVPSIHGHKVWNSSFLIMDYLTRNKPPKGSQFMDLGCGWGLLGIQMVRKYDCKVTAVDADEDVFPYLELHAAINKASGIETRKARFEKLRKKDLEGFHTIAGADICFWDELAPVLYKLIRKAIKMGVQRIIIADPGRSPFYKLVKKCEKDSNMKVKVIEKSTSTPKVAVADLLVVTPA